jgi:hypothetical protein
MLLTMKDRLEHSNTAKCNHRHLNLGRWAGNVLLKALGYQRLDQIAVCSKRVSKHRKADFLCSSQLLVIVCSSFVAIRNLDQSLPSEWFRYRLLDFVLQTVWIVAWYRDRCRASASGRCLLLYNLFYLYCYQSTCTNRLLKLDCYHYHFHMSQNLWYTDYLRVDLACIWNVLIVTWNQYLILLAWKSDTGYDESITLISINALYCYPNSTAAFSCCLHCILLPYPILLYFPSLSSVLSLPSFPCFSLRIILPLSPVIMTDMIAKTVAFHF